MIYLQILFSVVLLVSDGGFFHGKVFRYYNLYMYMQKVLMYASVVVDLVRCREFLRKGFRV